MSNTDVDVMTLNIYVHANTKHVSADRGLKFIDFTMNRQDGQFVFVCCRLFPEQLLFGQNMSFFNVQEKREIKSDTNLFTPKYLSNQLSNEKNKRALWADTSAL